MPWRHDGAPDDGSARRTAWRAVSVVVLCLAVLGAFDGVRPAWAGETYTSDDEASTTVIYEWKSDGYVTEIPVEPQRPSGEDGPDAGMLGDTGIAAVGVGVASLTLTSIGVGLHALRRRF